MGKKKNVVIIGLTMLLVVGVMISNIFVASAAINEQVGTVRKRSTPIELVFYNFQASNLNVDDISKKNPSYKELTREDVFEKAQYLAFDSKGFLIPFEDIIIDQDQLDTINNDIVKGINLFKEAGKTQQGSYLSYPLTLTTPEGVETVFDIQLNIGGHQVANQVAGLNLAGNDITYDIANGELTWEDLRSLASVYAYDGSYTNTTIAMEAVQATVDTLNEKIVNGVTGIVPIQFLLTKGNAIGTFNVTLTKVPDTYTVTYNDGEEAIEIFPDQVYTDVVEGSSTPQFEGNLEREGYRFLGWTPTFQSTVAQNVVYSANWEVVPPISTPEEPVEPILPETPQEKPHTESKTIPETSDYHTIDWEMILFISGMASVYFMIKYKKEYK